MWLRTSPAQVRSRCTATKVAAASSTPSARSIASFVRPEIAPQLAAITETTPSATAPAPRTPTAARSTGDRSARSKASMRARVASSIRPAARQRASARSRFMAPSRSPVLAHVLVRDAEVVRDLVHDRAPDVVPERGLVAAVHLVRALEDADVIEVILDRERALRPAHADVEPEEERVVPVVRSGIVPDADDDLVEIRPELGGDVREAQSRD